MSLVLSLVDFTAAGKYSSGSLSRSRASLCVLYQHVHLVMLPEILIHNAMLV